MYSRKPTSRYEVLQLKKTFNTMMSKLGITEVDVEVKGPTQVRIDLMFSNINFGQ